MSCHYVEKNFFWHIDPGYFPVMLFNVMKRLGNASDKIDWGRFFVEHFLCSYRDNIGINSDTAIHFENITEFLE